MNICTVRQYEMEITFLGLGQRQQIWGLFQLLNLCCKGISCKILYFVLVLSSPVFLHVFIFPVCARKCFC